MSWSLLSALLYLLGAAQASKMLRQASGPEWCNANRLLVWLSCALWPAWILSRWPETRRIAGG